MKLTLFIFTALILFEYISCQEENTRYLTSGEEITISCPAEAYADVNWSFSSSPNLRYQVIFANNKKLDGNPRLLVEYEPTVARYALTITDFDTIVDPGMYMCSSLTLLSDVIFPVDAAVAPSGISLTLNTVQYRNGSTVVGTEGYQMHVSCDVTVGNPPPDVILTMNTEVVSNGSMIAEWFFTAARDNDGESIYCFAANVGIVLMTYITLDLKLKPTAPTLESAKWVREGENAMFKCKTSGGKPAPEISWEFDGPSKMLVTTIPPVLDSVTNTYTVTSEMTLQQVTSTDDQMNVTCLVNHEALRSAMTEIGLLSVFFVHVSITGKTILNINDSLNLYCSVTSSSPSFEIEWKINGVVEFRTQKLTVTNPGKMFHGSVITCLASLNGTDVREEKSVEITVRYYPDTGPTISGYVSQTALLENSKPLTLTCSTEDGNPLPVLQWNCPGIDTLYKSPNSKISLVRRTVTISRNINNETCSCLATQEVNNWRGYDFVDFNVYFGPNKVALQANGNMLESSTVIFSCNTTESNPTAIIRWFKNDEELDNIISVSDLVPGLNKGFTMHSNWTTVLDRADDGSEILCSSRNINGEIITDKLQLDIQYPVGDTKFYMLSSIAIETKKVVLKCESNGKPEPSYSITRSSRLVGDIQGDTNSGLLQISSVSRNEAGVYTCEATNEHGSESVDFNLVVNYHPSVAINFSNVTENDTDVVLLCRADGIPRKCNFQEWKHFGPDGVTEIRTIQGQNDDTESNLLLQGRVNYEDIGYYECSVENGIHDTSGNMYQKESAYLHVEGAPVIPDQIHIASVILGESVSMAVEFFSQPFGSVTWYHINDVQEGHAEQVIDFLENSTNIPKKIIKLSFYGKEVNIEGYVTVLEFENTKIDDFKTYRIEVKNVYGTQVHTMELRQATSLPPGEDNQTAVIVGAVIGVLLSIAIVCGIVAILWRRGIISKESAGCLSRKKEVPGNLYVNRAFDIGSNHSNTNNGLYQDLGPSENPAIHYEALERPSPTIYEDIGDSSSVTDRTPVYQQLTPINTDTAALYEEPLQLYQNREAIQKDTKNKANREGEYSLERINV